VINQRELRAEEGRAMTTTETPASASQPTDAELALTGVFSHFGRSGVEALGFAPVLRLTHWVLARPSAARPKRKTSPLPERSH
jgi:hypothetical protein